MVDLNKWKYMQSGVTSLFREGETRPVMMQRLQKRSVRTLGGRKDQGRKAGLPLKYAWVGLAGRKNSHECLYVCRWKNGRGSQEPLGGMRSHWR